MGSSTSDVQSSIAVSNMRSTRTVIKAIGELSSSAKNTRSITIMSRFFLFVVGFKTKALKQLEIQSFVCEIIYFQ